MSAVFADTFYWIAVTNLQDLAHEKAKAFAFSTTPVAICTTEDVLTEYTVQLRAASRRLPGHRLGSATTDRWWEGLFSPGIRRGLTTAVLG